MSLCPAWLTGSGEGFADSSADSCFAGISAWSYWRSCRPTTLHVSSNCDIPPSTASHPSRLMGTFAGTEQETGLHINLDNVLFTPAIAPARCRKNHQPPHAASRPPPLRRRSRNRDAGPGKTSAWSRLNPLGSVRQEEVAADGDTSTHTRGRKSFLRLQERRFAGDGAPALHKRCICKC